MERTVVTCDICRKEITNIPDDRYQISEHITPERIRPWDVCSDCWYKILDTVKNMKAENMKEEK